MKLLHYKRRAPWSTFRSLRLVSASLLQRGSYQGGLSHALPLQTLCLFFISAGLPRKTAKGFWGRQKLPHVVAKLFATMSFRERSFSLEP